MAEQDESEEALESEETGKDELTGEEKLCTRCGCDVTNKRRAKDAEGGYICYSCAAEEIEGEGRNVLASPCDDCHRLFHPLDLFRVGGDHICEECANDRALGHGRNGSGGGSEGGHGKLWFGLFWLAVLAWVILHFFNIFEPAPAPKQIPAAAPGIHKPAAARS